MSKRFLPAFAILLLLLLTKSAGAQHENALPFVSKNGHRYEMRGGQWFMGSPGGETSTPVDVTKIIVRTTESWSPSQIPTTGAAAPRSVSERIRGGYQLIEIPVGADPIEYMKRIESMRGVEWARFEVEGQYYFTPNDTYFSLQWGLPLAKVPQAWDHVMGNPSVKVGIIDTAVDPLHPDLDVTLAGGIGGAGSGVYHGTAVAGLLAASTNNGTGMSGVAGGTNLYNYGIPYPVFGEMNVVQGIYALADAGVRVINLSLGYGNPDPSNFPMTTDAIDYATDVKNAVVVCASGNLPTRPCDFPASYSKTIAVSAIAENGTILGQPGAIDVVAPGASNILTTDVTGCFVCSDPPLCSVSEGGHDEGDYMCVEDNPSCDDCFSGPCPYCFGGTSAAAPFAAGVAGLILSANPSLTWQEVRDIMRWTADKLPGMNGMEWTKVHGYGLVNAEAAVLAALAIPADGVISANTTWPAKVVPGRDIVVAQGVTLTLNAGTQVFCGLTDALDHEPFFTDRVELHVRGSLVANGTTGNSVVFRSANRTPTETDWVHIQVLGGSLSLMHAEVRNTEYGIGVTGSGAINISSCSFSKNQVADVRLYGTPSTAVISNSTFLVGGGTGIDVSTSNVQISGNTITGDATSLYGIKVSTGGSSATMAGNTISGFTNPSSTPDYGHGISLQDGLSTITSNIITGCRRGIYVSKGAHQIGQPEGGNDIGYCTGSGIYATCSGPGQCPAVCDLSVTIRHNSVHDNGTGVVVRKTATGVDLGTASSYGYNSILNNTQYCLNNTSTCGTVSAQGNYFGTCNPLPPLCWNGAFDLGNYLCSPPSGAPVAWDPGDGQEPTLTKTGLLGNSPNPFNPTTTIQFAIDASAPVQISIFDVAGRRVGHEDLGNKSRGLHSWVWNGKDSGGQPLASGVYFVQLRAGSSVDTHKIVMLK